MGRAHPRGQAEAVAPLLTGGASLVGCWPRGTRFLIWEVGLVPVPASQASLWISRARVCRGSSSGQWATPSTAAVGKGQRTRRQPGDRGHFLWCVPVVPQSSRIPDCGWSTYEVWASGPEPEPRAGRSAWEARGRVHSKEQVSAGRRGAVQEETATRGDHVHVGRPRRPRHSPEGAQEDLGRVSLVKGAARDTSTG